MDNRERDQTISELVDWFKEKNLDPAEGGRVMIRLMAFQFVSHSQNHRHLAEAINITSELMALEIAEFLRGGRLTEKETLQ